jgi:hypothetical protein
MKDLAGAAEDSNRIGTLQIIDSARFVSSRIGRIFALADAGCSGSIKPVSMNWTPNQVNFLRVDVEFATVSLFGLARREV